MLPSSVFEYHIAGGGMPNVSSEKSPGIAPKPEPTLSPPTPVVRKVAHWLILLGGVIFGGAFVYGGAATMLQSPQLFQLALQHFPAAIGLPSAAIAALCIVVFLESSSGPIQFEGLGFKFNGASGPIVLWVFCFLAIAGAIKLLW
jgi:hypothetical protein